MNQEDRDTGYKNTGCGNEGEKNSGDWNSGDWNVGYGNSGNWNVGYGNSGNKNVGVFNTNEPTVRCFNLDSGKKWCKIDHPHFQDFRLTEWVPLHKMTRDEKKKNPSYSTTGGFLRKYTYKEAWKNFWAQTDEKNKQKFLNLPNFNAKIFEKITGIKITK